MDGVIPVLFLQFLGQRHHPDLKPEVKSWGRKLRSDVSKGTTAPPAVRAPPTVRTPPYCRRCPFSEPNRTCSVKRFVHSVVFVWIKRLCVFFSQPITSSVLLINVSLVHYHSNYSTDTMELVCDVIGACTSTAAILDS